MFPNSLEWKGWEVPPSKSSVDWIVADSVEATLVVLNQNHPKYAWFQEWLKMSEENQRWYNENVWKNFDLVEDGWIMLFWDVFEWKDETSTPNNIDIFDNGNWSTLFGYNVAKEHAESKGKRLPDWEKYKKLLPWSAENKSAFLQKVLGLTFTGCFYKDKSDLYDLGVVGFYWSDKSQSPDDADVLVIDKGGVTTYYDDKSFSFCLRCIRN